MEKEEDMNIVQFESQEQAEHVLGLTTKGITDLGRKIGLGTIALTFGFIEGGKGIVAKIATDVPDDMVIKKLLVTSMIKAMFDMIKGHVQPNIFEAIEKIFKNNPITNDHTVQKTERDPDQSGSNAKESMAQADEKPAQSEEAKASGQDVGGSPDTGETNAGVHQ